jgi:hypothetical protein
MIAHCVVGTAYETKVYQRIQHKHPIYNEARYKQLGQWRDEVSTLTNQSVDFFLSLEFRHMPRRSDLMNHKLEVQSDVVSYEMQFFRELRRQYGNDFSKWIFNKIDPNVLTPLISYLHPKRVVLYNSTPMCVERKCLCESLPNMNPGFMEQMAKNAACLRAIEDVERERGSKYKWISRTRTDGDFIDPLRMSSALKRPKNTVWIGQSMNRCHGGGDWAAVMPRHLAPSYFYYSDHVSCDWLDSLRKDSCNWAVENTLWRWMETQRVNVKLLSFNQ